MKKLLYSLSLLIAIVFYISSCTKIRTTDLGGELIPAVDNVNVFDTTLEVITELYQLPDSTRITRTSDHALGILNDPAFGKTTGEMYFKLQPQLFGSYPFGKSRDSLIGLDSVVLSLKYKSLYGDSNSIQSIRVFEIDQAAAFKDSLQGYIINSAPFLTADLLASKENLLFNTLNDSLTYIRIKDTITTSSELRIKLPNDFGMRLMSYDTTTYKTDSAFNTKFKGFAVKADEGSSIKRALAYFNLADGNTRLSFHYRTTKNAVADTAVTDFILRGSGNANLVQRDPTGTDYGNALVNGTGNQEKLFLQTSPGSYVLVKIPGLDALSNRLIYKATLITEKLESTEDNIFKVPNLLFLDAVDSANNKFLTIPNSFEPQDNSAFGYNPALFGGFLANNRYEFDLSRYVQGIVTRKEKSYALRMYAPYITRPTLAGTADITRFIALNGPIAAGRVVVSGGAHPVKKMRLYIVYSKL